MRSQYVVLLFALALVVLLAPMGTAAAAAVTPEGLQAWFDAKFVFVAMGIGLLWKYVPQLKGWTNAAIPWVNAIGYMLAKVGAVGTMAAVLGVEPAYAGGAAAGGIIGAGLLGAAHAIAARQGWEAFLRPIVEWASLTMTNRRHPAA